MTRKQSEQRQQKRTEQAVRDQINRIAETMERQTDQTVKVIMSLLGPVVLMVIVSLVGFAVIAMLLPIFRMNLLIQ